MNDITGHGNDALRNRFRKWALSALCHTNLQNCALLLADEHGGVLECVTNIPGHIPSEADDSGCGFVLSEAAFYDVVPMERGAHRYRLALFQQDEQAERQALFVQLAEELAAALDVVYERQENKRLQLVLEMVKSFQGKIDVNEVLNEATGWMIREYPDDAYDFLLSQDNDSLISPVKPLVIQHQNADLCSRAFIEGRSIIQHVTDPDTMKSYREIAAPLKGKQGIYGVLHVMFTSSTLQTDDSDFLTMLAENTGSAFEIAKLYEQSTTLVNELRIINEITKRLNRSLQLGEIFEFARRELLSIFAADYCCILQINKEKRHLVVQSSNAPELVDDKYDIAYGFAGIICRSREPVIISDYQFNNQVESKLMKTTRARSLIGSPIIVNSETVGAILLVHRRPNFFSYDNFKLLQVLSGHIGLALTNAMLHAEMRRMVITDQLTNLYVRHYLYEQIAIMQKKDYCGSLVVVDIDDFKRVNDTYGHQIGDNILIQVSSMITRNIRDSDVAARWGGEELAVYLPHMNRDQAYKVAERIRNTIAQETNPKVTISCGIADWTRDDGKINADNLFHRADLALYQAKNSGKNQIRIAQN